MQSKERERRVERARCGGGGGRTGSCTLVASHASRAETAPAFSTGVNPLFDTQRSMSSNEGDGGALKASSGKTEATRATKKRPTTKARRPAAAAAGEGGGAARRQRNSENARRKRAASPQSTVTTSTTQSDGSRRNVTAGGAATATTSSSRGVGQSPQVANSKPKSYSRSAPASRNGSINKSSSRKEEFVPAPLVPALLAPVPPPPSKRKAAQDLETGEGGVGEVLEDAPDKTIMEMLQTYLKKQDLYTRMVLVVVLLVLAGGALGAYVVMLWYAISKQNTKYIVLVSVFSVVLLWVLWKVRKNRL